MKKDKIYSLRMNSKVREALQRASNKEQRSVASLLDKIIMDYLTREGFLSDADYGVERRQFNRKKITVPTETTFTKGQTQKSVPGVVLDLSLGGALITYPKRSDVRFSSVGKLPEFGLELQVPGQKDVLHFDCNAKHMRDTGEEIHVGASFSNPQDDELQKLDEYLSDKQPGKKDG
ncbi:MAG: PilZ domain-containing protein [Desulfobacterales bacterium]|nr:PilZ domain-containing protein [Desulfobacterales bacterium]